MDSNTTNTTGWILWGRHGDYADGQPIKLTGGTLPECRREMETRKRDGGWALTITDSGERPWFPLPRESRPWFCQVCSSSAPFTRTSVSRGATLFLCAAHELVCWDHLVDPCRVCDV